jgi:hypothetical protein
MTFLSAPLTATPHGRRPEVMSMRLAPSASDRHARGFRPPTA